MQAPMRRYPKLQQNLASFVIIKSRGHIWLNLYILRGESNQKPSGKNEIQNMFSKNNSILFEICSFLFIEIVSYWTSKAFHFLVSIQIKLQDLKYIHFLC